MASFDEVQFPPSISFGATGGPKFSTNVIILSSGYESRNSNWNLARAEYDISTGIKTKADMDAVIPFFYARNGRARGFRFKDWKDYQAVAEPVYPVGGGVYALAKSYVSGSVGYQRIITKPVAGTITVSGGGSVDPTTGLITGGSGGTASFEFDVPVRFDIDYLEVEIQDFAGDEFASIVRKIPLIEVRI
jgi:uncharacterized protein (TIGR02217 family)